jgi:AcrR family transcriptional regulator
MAEAQRRRLSPDARRALLLDAALDTFVAQGYAQSGLAEIAAGAGVSKTLLYHYFPDGRPELYREVVTRLTGPALDEVRDAARAPISAERRLARIIDAVLSLFEAHPAAYRLAVLEPNGSGDPGIAGQAMALRTNLVAALAAVAASANRPAEEITAGA